VGRAVCPSGRPAAQIQAQRQGRQTWYVDETSIKVKGRWRYLYRAIDWDGNLVDSMLRAKRDMQAAKRFFRRALRIVGHAPERGTSDGYHTFPTAIADELGEEVTHHINAYLNNHLEQDYRGIKQRSYPMLGFQNFFSAARFCAAYDELRNYLRPRQRRGENL
jgi:putative transposase